jgi:hypothetical protein
MVETLESPNSVDADIDNRFSHYAEAVSVTEGYVLGKPVVAICGTIFIPSRDPKKFPICPICKKIAEALLLEEE